MRVRSLLVVCGLAASAAGCSSLGGGRTRGTPRPVILAAAIDSLIGAPKWRSAHWGILIVDAERGDTLYSRNAGKLFMPASNQKILTGAVALALLGPDYRYRTTFAASGQIQEGTLRGDLLVIGRGDPSVSDRMRGDAMVVLREAADSLGARGIRRITGQVRAVGNPFPDANLGFGWSWDDLDFTYSARIDELTLNEGFTRLVVYGASTPGATPSARTAPARTFPAIRMLATTIPRDSSTGTARRPPLLVRQDSSGGGLLIEGSVGAGDSAQRTITYRDPSVAYLMALREAFAERGITVDDVASDPDRADGDGVSRAPRTGTGADTLFALWSPPLREILRAFEKPSQNQIGELLLKTIALERTGVGSADSGSRVVRDQVIAWGASSDGLRVRDGSGLSRHNVVSPETIVRVLTAIRNDTAFSAFYESLPIAGVDGTLGSRMRNTPAQGNMHAKTGSIDLARSLSGYVTAADGRVLIFSILCNNFTTSAREVEEVANQIGAYLAALRRRR